MIKSFKGEFAEAIHHRWRIPKGFPTEIAKVARGKLTQVNNAARRADLAAVNPLEAVKRKLGGQAFGRC